MAIKINYYDEYSRLKRVALYRPSADEIEQKDVESAMYSSIPDTAIVLQEFDEVVAKLQELDVEVVVLDGNKSMTKTPNMIFLRDVAFVYGDDIFLARMKHSIRADEPLKFIALLTEVQPNLNGKFKHISEGTMEGADLLIDSNKTILAYTGSRTSTESVSEVAKQLSISKVRHIPANIDGVPQHLLGGIHILGPELLTRRVEYCPEEVGGYKNICFTEDDEVSKGFSLNIITIAPNEILMPKNCPNTKFILESHGVVCHEVGIDEIHKMGGGLACMALPLARNVS